MLRVLPVLALAALWIACWLIAEHRKHIRSQWRDHWHGYRDHSHERGNFQ